jgi:hypothetical protein
MTQHPITPPPTELVEQWADEFYSAPIAQGDALLDIATRAVQWGADQELEACCEWVDWKWSGIKSRELRASRRHKPPSLKEQALETLKYPKDFWSEAEVDTIRLALEALPND